MITANQVRDLALALAGAEEKPHFEKASFRVKGKIFCTLSVRENRAVLKLTLIDQSVFCDFKTKAFFPVPGAWGKKGWTFVDLGKVRKDMFCDALRLSYEQVAPKKLKSKI
ncbi:MAG TPA: MmcQ/YjbR family DNA-binding protein [Chryseosolibacter sp.]|nr:MmcQ/YjbR family DNA-binding protein [Chryseosolibacter sp.]